MLDAVVPFAMLLPVADVASVEVEVAPVPVPDVPLAMPLVELSVAAAPVALTGAVAPDGVVAVVSVVPVVASCLLQAVRPSARTPAIKILIVDFIVVTSWVI